MGGAKLTVTCRGETQIPPRPPSPGQPSPGYVIPFTRNIGESLGTAQCPYGHENKKESAHTQSPLSPGKSNLCPFKHRNAERGRKFGMTCGDESVHSSHLHPQMSWGASCIILSTKQSVGEREMLGLHFSPFKKKNIYWKTKCFTLVENIPENPITSTGCKYGKL